MEFFRLPQFHLHGSKWSDWHLGSPSGSGVQIGTPEVRVGVDSQSIRVAISEVKDGRLTRMVTLKGSGVGVGAGIGLTIPFVNFSWSPKEVPGTKFNVPGAGSRIRYSAFSPDPMEPADSKAYAGFSRSTGSRLERREPKQRSSLRPNLPCFRFLPLLSTRSVFATAWD